MPRESRMCPRTAETFLENVDCRFGTRMLKAYVAKMKGFSETGLVSMRKDAFIGCIMLMGEVWRRFVFDRDCFPFRLWKELSGTYSTEEFLEQYSRLQDMKHACPKCFDSEFSHPILEFIPQPHDPHHPETILQVDALRHLLGDLASFAPLSSDIVECLHGFYQKKVHRHCGAKPSDPIAQQVTLWASILSSYRSFWQSLWKKAGDFKINFRIHRFGRKGCNQWSDDASKKANQGESRFEGATGESKSMFQRIADIPASRKKPRRICGYSNLSQRQFRFDLF